uniref:3-deoxy-D-manno-octulosonic acid transferase n=1 Tax=Flavobacterium sp. TaxID=239 RepID=UPI00404A456D
MKILYNFLIVLVAKLLPIIAFFSPKIKLFVEGRKQVSNILKDKISANDYVVWFHAASLGEFEQGIPVIERYKNEFPTHKILVTFFSPSGYEVRKNNKLADGTIYLPLDTISNVNQFLKLANPQKVFFIKYEFWPNYLEALAKKKIPVYLISGIFRKDQIFFKSYGSFYRKALQNIDYFFVQNETSKALLTSIGFTNVTISGDTRFDRVGNILKQNNQLDFIESFKNNTITIVVGSSWPKDEAFFIDFINRFSGKAKFIFAPHLIQKEAIQTLKNTFQKQTILYSEIEGKDLKDFDILIVDAIGFLTKIYSYADLAYVGGGFGTAGLHNILEPATFGIPVVIGPNFEKFSEAKDLVKLGGCLVVSDQESFQNTFQKLISDTNFRTEKGKISADFVKNNQGATETVFDYLKKKSS